MLLQRMVQAVSVGAIATVAGLSIAGPVTAQTNSTPSRHLTVTGSGQASAPADEAALVFLFGKSNSYAYSDDAPEDYDQDAPIAVQDLSSVAAALMAAGVSENAISYTEDQFGTYRKLALIVSIDAPTRDRINALLAAVDTADTAAKPVELSSFEAYYATKNCEDTETAAREEAMANAQAQARALGSASNVETSEISSISTYINWATFGSNVSGCPNDLEAILQSPNRYSKYNRLAIPEIPVNITVTTTYFID